MIRFFLTLIGLATLIVCTGSFCVRAQQGPSLEWGVNIGGSTYDRVSNIAVDKDGNTYITGEFRSTTDFDPGSGAYNLTPTSSGDIFVLKLDATGSFVWAKQFEGSTGMVCYTNAIAVDDSGNVFTTGRFQGTVDFDPGSNVYNLVAVQPTSTTYYDIYISKLDKDGNFVWAKSFGGAASIDIGYDIKTNKAGEVIITGDFMGTVDFNPGGVGGQFTSLTTGSSGFILKFKADGTVAWVQSFPRTPRISIDIDDSLNIYGAGTFSADIQFNTTNGTETFTPLRFNGWIYQSFGMFKLDSAGVLQWFKQINTSFGWTDIAVDNNGSLYISSSFSDSVDLDPDQNNTHLIVPPSYVWWGSTYYETRWCILKLDAIGNFVWASLFEPGSSSTISPWSIAVEPLGKAIYTTGYFTGTVDFDPGADVYNLEGFSSVNKAYISKLNGDGSFGWARALGNDTIPVFGYGIALNDDNDIYAAGYFGKNSGGVVNFSPDTTVSHNLTSNGNTDNFIIKLADDCRYLSREFPIEGEHSFCKGSSYTYSVDSIPGATYLWTLPDGWTDDGNDKHFINAIAGETGTISVQIITQCDSTIPSFTAIKAMEEPYITVDSFQLGTASQNYSSWQWYLNGNAISGATEPTYTVSENGEYCVVVTLEDCTDTACYEVTNVSVNDLNGISNLIGIYPNPADDILHINSPVSVNVHLYSIEGRSILYLENAKTIPVKNIPQGVYMLHILDRNGNLVKVEKVVKER